MPNWVQDKADYSWSLRDADGCLFRANNVGDGVWVIAWQERDGLRIGGRLYPSIEAAKEMIEGLANFQPELAIGAA